MRSKNEVTYKRIVVAVDGSAHSERALDHAIQLANLFGAQLQIVHAIKRIDMTRTVLRLGFSSKAAIAERELYETLKNEVSRWIERYERKASSAGIADVTTKILADGSRSEVQMITEYAQTLKADMIVIGSRGLGSFKRLVLGSVASGVVSHASCPVYVAR